MTNKIRKSISEKGAAVGSWAQMGSAEFCEILGQAGFDFVLVDLEHGAFGIETAVSMMRAAERCGAAPIVRVPDSTPSLISKVLDAGAHGVVVPSVGSAAEARRIVEAARYAPHGLRGACPCVGATAHGVLEWGEYIRWSSETVMLAVIIETAAGVENFREIVAVPGIDIIALGPFDLSQAMGYKGDWQHPEVRRKQEEIVEAALMNGKEVLPSVFDSEHDVVYEKIEEWKKIGARVFAVSGDRFMLAAGFSAISKTLKI